MLFKYWTGRWWQRPRRIPSVFAPASAAPWSHARSVLMARSGDAMARGGPGGTGLGPPQHRAAPTAESRYGAGGINGPLEVIPTALHSNVGLIDPPGSVGR